MPNLNIFQQKQVSVFTFGLIIDSNLSATDIKALKRVIEVLSKVSKILSNGEMSFDLTLSLTISHVKQFT